MYCSSSAVSTRHWPRPPTLIAGRSPVRTSAYACAAEMSRISDTSVRGMKRRATTSVCHPQVRASAGVVHRPRRSGRRAGPTSTRISAMTDLPTPTASRLRRPSWRDSRLVVGVLLVLVSTVLGALVVARADDRVPVWAARGQVAPGQQLTESDLVRVDVLLGDGAATLPVGRHRPARADLRAARPPTRRARPRLGGRSAPTGSTCSRSPSSSTRRRPPRSPVGRSSTSTSTGRRRARTVGTPTYAGPERALEARRGGPGGR